jgi:hypothetical protein
MVKAARDSPSVAFPIFVSTTLSEVLVVVVVVGKYKPMWTSMMMSFQALGGYFSYSPDNNMNYIS